jgi:phosphoribosylanthranilate isomerase
MITQIYTMQSPDEALGVVEAGADRVGVTPAARGLPGEIDTAAARAIVEAVGERATTVALTVERDPGAIVAMAQAVLPDVLHLCPEPGALTPDAVARLRECLPPVKIMQAIAVDGPTSVDRAVAFEPVVDELILDTDSSDVEGIGASGAVHDWAVSAEIVRRVRVPVLLAGGLGPHNVAAAIEAVRPHGVDSLTHTNRPAPGGGFCKDLDTVHRFVDAAHRAGASAGSAARGVEGRRAKAIRSDVSAR